MFTEICSFQNLVLVIVFLRIAALIAQTNWETAQQILLSTALMMPFLLEKSWNIPQRDRWGPLSRPIQWWVLFLWVIIVIFPTLFKDTLSNYKLKILFGTGKLWGSFKSITWFSIWSLNHSNGENDLLKNREFPCFQSQMMKNLWQSSGNPFLASSVIYLEKVIVTLESVSHTNSTICYWR